MADLDSIEAAIYTQLATLLTTAVPAGPLLRVGRFAGEPSRDRRVSTDMLGVLPSVALALESDIASDEVAPVGGPRATVMRCTWRVYVAAVDLRGDASAVKGSSTTGVYSLLSQVQARLSGLVITDLWRGGRLRHVDTKPYYVTRGAYVYVQRYAALYEQASVEPVDTTPDITEIRGDVNLVDIGDDPTNPAAQFDADTT